jgi:hypothetical protein
MATNAASDSKKSNTMDWIFFIVWTIIFFAMLIWVPQWFWLVIPFPLTYLVKAMDAM